MLNHPGPRRRSGPGVMHRVAQPGDEPNVSNQVCRTPEGMTVVWDVSTQGEFDSAQLVCPGRTASRKRPYWLKLAIVRAGTANKNWNRTHRTERYLAPTQFPCNSRPEAQSSAFLVTKVIYLPDSEFQELALAGVKTLVSARLRHRSDRGEPGRGAISAIVRLGDRGSLRIPDEPIAEAGVSQRASYDNAQTSDSPHDGLRRRSKRTAIRHAMWRADRFARTSQRSLGVPAGDNGRDSEPLRHASEADRHVTVDVKQKTRYPPPTTFGPQAHRELGRGDVSGARGRSPRT